MSARFPVETSSTLRRLADELSRLARQLDEVADSGDATELKLTARQIELCCLEIGYITARENADTADEKGGAE